MVAGVKVLSGVPVLGIVAAADVAAALTHAQVYRVVAQGYAFRAGVFGGGRELGEGGDMLTEVGHG